MITYNNIITALNNFATNHFFIKTFSHGNVEEMDLSKEGQYPLMHVNYTGANYDVGIKTYNFEVYIMDLPSDKIDKISYQREVISDSEQCAEDLLADIVNGGNIFNFQYQYELTSASLTPLEEETKNVLAGVVLDLGITIPYQYDSCNAPLEGVTPISGGPCPPGIVRNSSLSYEVEISSGATFTLPDITVTQVNGTTSTSPAQEGVTCEWTQLSVINSEETILEEVPTYPAGNRIVVDDIEVEDVDQTTRYVPVGPVICEWKDITVVDQDSNVLATATSYPSDGEIEVTIPIVATSPAIISHRRPSYTSISSGDYADLYNSGYFDIYNPSTPVNMVQLGADNYTLASNNVFGNTSRYTSTDGTPSITGTARFSTYGTGVSNVVIDHYYFIMWYNTPMGGSSTTWNNSQAEVDSLNSSSFAGRTNWIVPTRDMLSLSACPNNNEAIHTSPNLIEDTGTRRYITCERLPYINQGYQVFYSNGGESTQTLTTTAGGQNRVVAACLLTLAELEALV